MNGFIYLMQIKNKPFCKIGHTLNIIGRLAEIQTLVRKKVILLACGFFYEIIELEAIYHKEYAHRRTCDKNLPSPTEWFTLTPKDIKTITSEININSSINVRP